MKHTNKKNLLIILFGLLFILFVTIGTVYISESISMPIIKTSTRVKLFFQDIFYKEKIAKVICDNCGISQILVKHPYTTSEYKKFLYINGYYEYNNQFYFCKHTNVVRKGKNNYSYDIECELIPSAKKETFEVLNLLFARDDKSIYCASKILGEYQGQKLGYNIYGSVPLDIIRDINYEYRWDGWDSSCVKHINTNQNISQNFQYYR